MNPECNVTAAPRAFSITSVLQNIPDTSPLRGYASIPGFVLSLPKLPCPGMSPSPAICWPCNIFHVILFSPLFIFKQWCTFSRCTPRAAHALLQPLPQEAATAEETKHLQFGQSHTWFLDSDQGFVTGVTSTFCQTIASPLRHLCSRH